MKRGIGYAVAFTGGVLGLGSCVLRSPALLSVNGYHSEAWRVGAVFGIILLVFGAVLVRRAE